MLHVLIGAGCNNNCLFCMEADRRRRAARWSGQSPADVRAMIASYEGRDEILFTSGEPTLDPDLLAYVSFAKERGYRTIGLITNGRRLAYADYVKRLVDSGITRVTVSIHGHQPNLHDGLTRCPGSFGQTLAGLDQLVRVQRSHGIQIHTSTVITQRTLPYLRDIFRLLTARGVDLVVYNVMMAKGRGAVHAARLMPRYGEVVRRVGALCARVDRAHLRRLRVEDLPPCFGRLLPAIVRGDPEEYEQFEESGSTGLPELEVVSEASTAQPLARHADDEQAPPLSAHHLPGNFAPGASPSPRCSSSRIAALDHSSSEGRLVASVRERVARVDLQAKGDYYLTQRSDKDSWLRVKGESCTRCALANRCAGVWEPYVSLYGWGDFTPVTGDEARDSRN